MAPPVAPPILTIGHSNHAYAKFRDLLRAAGATAVADVRSVPRSGRFPWFDGPALRAGLARDGIAYAFLGDALGGRPDRAALYDRGVADYEAMAREPAFAAGLARVGAGSARHRIALMCSEGDPTECHRCLLVGRAWAERGGALAHVMPDGAVVGHARVEERLLALAGAAAPDLFAPREERLAAAYRRRAAAVAFRRRDKDGVAAGPG